MYAEAKMDDEGLELVYLQCDAHNNGWRTGNRVVTCTECVRIHGHILYAICYTLCDIYSNIDTLCSVIYKVAQLFGPHFMQ